MLDAWTYLCGTTDQLLIHPADRRNLYTQTKEL